MSCNCVAFGRCPWHSEDMESDIPSILELQLKKSVALTANRGAGMSDRRIPPQLAVNQPDNEEQDDSLARLKKILAETKEMVAQAEALLASLRKPRDFYTQADGG